MLLCHQFLALAFFNFVLLFSISVLTCSYNNNAKSVCQISLPVIELQLMSLVVLTILSQDTHNWY